MDNSILKALRERRSVKRYDPERQVEEEKLSAILEAGTYAASGMGRQSPIMVVIQDKATRDILSKMNAEIGNRSSDPFYGAPTVVVVLADRNIPTAVEDGSLVLGNLMIAAHSLGVDSCWIHRAKQEFDSDAGKEFLKKWGVEGDYVGVGHCLLGYRADYEPKAAPRKADYIYRV